MKKTVKTMMTAAMFAAAIGSFQTGTVNNTNADYDPLAEEVQDVYGPPVVLTTTTPVTTIYTPETTEPVAVYGPPIAWTTTSETDMPITSTVTTVPVPVYGPPVAWIGDLNDDNRVDVFDMIEMRKAYTEGVAEISWLDLYRADVNNDGEIGIADLVMLQKYLLGEINDFNEPIPEPETTTTEPQYITSTETTTTETIPAPVYGPPIAFD